MNRFSLVLLSTLSAAALLAQSPAPAPATPAALIPPPALTPAPTAAQDAPSTPAPAKKPAKKKAPPSTLPFRGKLEAVDAKAMTVTLAGKEKQRVLRVTSKTRFEKDGQPVTFADLKVGDDVRGSYAKGKEGDQLVRLIVGAPANQKPPGEKPAKKPAKTEAAPAEAK